MKKKLTLITLVFTLTMLFSFSLHAKPIEPTKEPLPNLIGYTKVAAVEKLSALGYSLAIE